jgi:hypothetical protein
MIEGLLGEARFGDYLGRKQLKELEMKHNKMMLKLAAVSMFVAIAGAAAAANDIFTSFVTIHALRTFETSSGYLVDPDGDTILPAGMPSCPNNTYYEPQAGHTADYYDRMNKTLLAAFMAGRAVELEINGTSNQCGPNGYPAYEQVRMAASQ